jgi:hypothetical protein
MGFRPAPMLVGYRCIYAPEAISLQIALNHDTFSRNTRNQLKQVFDALRELMTPPGPPRRPIGFINPEVKGQKT